MENTEITAGSAFYNVQTFCRVRIESMAFPHQANKQNSKTQSGNHSFEFIVNTWLTSLETGPDF